MICGVFQASKAAESWSVFEFRIAFILGVTSELLK
jgi:hypothetical protein